MPQSVTEYRKTTGNHISWTDQKQAGQKQQDERVQQMAAQPGSHAGNRQRHDAIYAAVQLLSILSSVQNTSASPAITTGRANELATEARITRADNLELKRRIERVVNREVRRNTGQHSWTRNASETQRGQSDFAFSNAQPEPSLHEKSIISPVRSARANVAHLSGDIIPERSASVRDTKPAISLLTPDMTAELQDMAGLISATGHPLARRARRDIETEDHSAESAAEIIRHQIGSVRTLLSHAGLPHDAPVEGNNIPLVNSVVKYLSKSPDRAPNRASKLAQHLYRVTHEYGGRRNETLSESRVQSKIADWLSILAFGSPAETFVTEQLSVLVQKSNEGDAPPYVENARIRLQDLIGATNRWLSTPDALTKKYFIEKVLDAISPAIMWQPKDDQTFGRTEICSLEWGYVHAALRFAKDVGLDAHEWETQDAIDVGQALATLCDEAVAAPEWLNYFLLPAQLHALREGKEAAGNSNPDASVPDISTRELVSRETALRLFFTARNAERQRNDPFIRLQKSLENFKTRPALAKAILQERCPGLGSEKDFETQADLYLDADEHRCLTFPRGASFTDPRRKVIELPQINDEFAAQNRRIAEQLGDVDRILLPLAFTQLSAEESAFIEHAEVHKAEAAFSAAHAIRHTLMGANRHAIEGLTKHMPRKLELFSAKHGGEERIYALYPKQGIGYSLKRVDRNQDFYRNLYEEITGVSLRLDNDYRLSVTTLRDALKDSASNINTLYNAIRQNHENELQENLHAYGYAKTTYEKVTDFALSLIPFYECGRNIYQGKIKEAAIPCALDVLGLIPLAVPAARVVVKFGEALSFSALKALRQSSAHHIIRQMALAGSEALTVDSAAELVIAAARAFDPGIELIAVGGKAGMRRAQEFLTALRDIYPGAEKVATALAHRADLLVEPATSAIVKGQLPGMTYSWDVVKVGQRKGKDVFVRVIPKTGDKFGKKYYRNVEGELRPVYRSLSERLHNLRTEGLGGRGAIHAARDMSLAHHLDQAPPEIVEEIFQHLDLSELLTFYQSDARYRDIALSMMKNKWDRAQWQQQITGAVLADQSEVLDMIRSIKEREGLSQLEDFDAKELITKALDKNLSETTYRNFLNLIDFTGYTQPYFAGLGWGPIDILTVALKKKNVAAVRAIVDNPYYGLSEVSSIRRQCLLEVDRVVSAGNLDLIRPLYDSILFDVNSNMRYEPPLSVALDSPACGPEIIEYFLSKPGIDVAPALNIFSSNLNIQKFALILHDQRANINYLMQYPNGEQSTVLTSAIERAVAGSPTDMEIFDLVLAHPDVQVSQPIIRDGISKSPLSFATSFLLNPTHPITEDTKNRIRIIINKLKARL